MANIPMADSIASIPEFKAWYSVFKQMLGEVDLTKLLVYIVDTVDASAIPYLAEQFDVLGYKGMKLAQTENDQRELIKRAIELHKYKGTEWAIKQALISIGFSDIKLKKGIADGYDHWAKFGIEITNTSLQLTDASVTDITNMVAEYKRAVCVLMDISMSLVYQDSITFGQDIATCLPAISANDNMYLSKPLIYDGSAEYDGANNYSGDTDVATIEPL